MADAVIIRPENDGPLYIKGTVQIVTPGGREIAVDGEEVWLCRCGHSADKPFCDGTHERINFQSSFDAPVEAAQPAAAASPASPLESGSFEEVARADQLGEGDLLGVRVDGQPVVLGKVDGQIYAIGGICSHQFALLEEGEMEDGCVMCPVHNSGFSIKTGEPKYLPAVKPVPTYEVKVEDGKVLVSRQPRVRV